MAKMVVIRSKPVRYPSGPTGKEYHLGEEFDTLSDRDTKAFTLIRAAKEVPHVAAAATPRGKAMKAEAPAVVPPATAPAPADGLFEQGTNADGTPRRTYKRRDMVSEG